MKKVLVIQTWGIGDMIMTTPMLHVLRTALPNAHVTVVAGSLAAGDVIRGSDLCDEVRSMSFRKRSVLDILLFFSKVRLERFDAAIVATGLSPKVGLLLRLLSGLKLVAGGGIASRGWGYTHWRQTNLMNHRSLENIQILKLLLPDAETNGNLSAKFHLNQAQETDAALVWREHELEGHVVMGLHPGCGVFEQDKKLPEPWCWDVISRFLTEFPNGKVALFFGPEDRLFEAGSKDMAKRVVRFQDMPLSVVAACIARTNVFLCGDTGLGHVAAAVGVPVVTVAGPTRINQTQPLGKRNLIVKTDYSLPCMPCFETPLFSKCPISQKCITTVSVQKAFDAIAQILEEVGT
ncbi:MAG: glycosyltransferase family 9 protein [Nitrospira sp.]|jgi:heptosyltransferase-2|nr:glycosyltransferase family 9 protein [Nitrospira sp.]MCC7473392.1 glycosyltransferase family 9 protein [Candidatus Nomurabacteria bacterium]